MNKVSIISAAPNLPCGSVLLQGEIPNNKGILGHPRKLDVYAIVYVYSGTGQYMDENGYVCKIVPGSLMILFPGLAHSYGGDSPWGEIFFIFNGSVVKSLEESGLIDRRQPVLRVLPHEYWRRRFEEALPDTIPQSDSAVARNLFNVLNVLVDMLDESRKGIRGDRDEFWLKRARQAIEQSVLEGKELKEVSIGLGERSTEAFRKRFTRMQGCSPSRYRYRVQIEQASLLLRSSNDNIEKIADKMGFYDAFHFSKRFKAATGLSPSQFKQRYIRAEGSHPIEE